MPFGIDIQEDEILSWGHEILENLLADHTTGENIIWATDDYSARGDGYQAQRPPCASCPQPRTALLP